MRSAAAGLPRPHPRRTGLLAHRPDHPSAAHRRHRGGRPDGPRGPLPPRRHKPPTSPRIRERLVAPARRGRRRDGPHAGRRRAPEPRPVHQHSAPRVRAHARPVGLGRRDRGHRRSLPHTPPHAAHQRTRANRAGPHRPGRSPPGRQRPGRTRAGEQHLGRPGGAPPPPPPPPGPAGGGGAGGPAPPPPPPPPPPPAPPPPGPPGGPRARPRAPRHFPPLGDLAAQERPRRLVLSAEDLARLHDHATAPLATAGITAQWPPALLGALTATALVGSHHAADEGTANSGFLGLDRLVDCRWHISLDGEPLTDEEMTALADAAWPLIRMRGRWLLIDPDTARRARHRDLAPLPSLDALAAALSGTLTLDGELLDAQPAGTLATLVDALRQAPEDPRPVSPPAGLNASLRHYQRRALTWLAHTLDLGFGALLADDMGLGKTLTTIALHLHRSHTHGAAAGPTLVVCPASLITNWQREIARFAPDTTAIRYHGTTRSLDTEALDHTTITITTYGTLRRDPLLTATQWGLVVADEAQHIKNPASATAKTLRDVPARARIAVTGTPVENNLTELWAILDWTNPGLFGTRTAFRARYGTVEKDPGAPAATGLARLIAPFMLRRRKSDPGIAPELPGKVHHHRVVALTDEQTGL
ncbi:SNF2-related protein [Streptomyces galbus]|uniref:DEAD/DEAH box helicase n=1 Tax=Streptomyces galbus TaxID=33898 RepID=UPI003814BCAD